MTRTLFSILLLAALTSQAHAQASTMGGPCVDASQANTDYCQNKRINAELDSLRERLRRLEQSKEK